MKDGVVEDKRRLDSCKHRETLAGTVQIGWRLTALFRRASLWLTLAWAGKG